MKSKNAFTCTIMVMVLAWVKKTKEEQKNTYKYTKI